MQIDGEQVQRRALNEPRCHVMARARRSPSPIGAAREPSWLNFRQAAQLRKRANRARLQVMGALTLAHAAVWAPQGALPALLLCLLLGSRGHVGLDEVCLMGACHQAGLGIAAKLWLARRSESTQTWCERALIGAFAAACGMGLIPIGGSRNRRSVWLGVAKFVGGCATRAVSDAIPVLADESRLVRLALEDGTSSCYVGEMEDAADGTTMVFGSRALALRGAPFLGSAVGFAFGFCLTLPLVGRASLEEGGGSFLPKRLGKLFAWYASLRRTTEHVPSNRTPPTCHQRAVAARDAWRWAHAILSVILLLATVALRFAHTPTEEQTAKSELDDSRSSKRSARIRVADGTERSSLLASSTRTMRRSQENVVVRSKPPKTEATESRLVSSAALCADAALVAAQLMGALVLQIALRLPPREAAISVVVAYAGLVPCAAGLLGALVLRVSSSSRSSDLSCRRRKQRHHPMLQHNLVLLRDERPTAKTPDVTKRSNKTSAEDEPVSTPKMSRVRPRSLSTDAMCVPSPPPPYSSRWSEPLHQHKRTRRLERSASSDGPHHHDTWRRTGDLEHAVVESKGTTQVLPPAENQPDVATKIRTRRRSACAVALTFTALSSCLACAVATLWNKSPMHEGPVLAPGLVLQREVGARLALASFGCMCAAMPSFAIIARPPDLLARPRAAFVRAIPFVIAGLAVRHLNRSRRDEDVVPSESDESEERACREFAAPPNFRFAARAFVSINTLVLLSLATLLLAAALCLSKPKNHALRNSSRTLVHEERVSDATPHASTQLLLPPTTPTEVPAFQLRAARDHRGHSGLGRCTFCNHKRSSSNYILPMRNSFSSSKSHFARAANRRRSPPPVIYRSVPHYESFPVPHGERADGKVNHHVFSS